MTNVERWNLGGLKTLAATRGEKFLGVKKRPRSDQLDERQARATGEAKRVRGDLGSRGGGGGGGMERAGKREVDQIGEGGRRKARTRFAHGVGASGWTQWIQFV